jgi:hypothetical protein
MALSTVKTTVTPLGPGGTEMSSPPTPLAVTLATFSGLTVAVRTSVKLGAVWFTNFAVFVLFTCQGEGMGNVPELALSL